jgi:serine/threonine protein kinase
MVMVPLKLLGLTQSEPPIMLPTPSVEMAGKPLAAETQPPLLSHSASASPMSSTAAQCHTPQSGCQTKTLKDIRNFKLQAKVGEGAYGTVWSALHPGSGRQYAIKIIQKSLIEKVGSNIPSYHI